MYLHAFIRRGGLGDNGEGTSGGPSDSGGLVDTYRYRSDADLQLIIYNATGDYDSQLQAQAAQQVLNERAAQHIGVTSGGESMQTSTVSTGPYEGLVAQQQAIDTQAALNAQQQQEAYAAQQATAAAAAAAAEQRARDEAAARQRLADQQAAAAAELQRQRELYEAARLQALAEQAQRAAAAAQAQADAQAAAARTEQQRQAAQAAQLAADRARQQSISASATADAAQRVGAMVETSPGDAAGATLYASAPGAPGSAQSKPFPWLIVALGVGSLIV